MVSDVIWGVTSLGSDTDSQERSLRCAKVVLLKPRDKTLGQKELLPQDCEEQLSIYFGVGGSKEKGSSKRTFIC